MQNLQKLNFVKQFTKHKELVLNKNYVKIMFLDKNIKHSNEEFCQNQIIVEHITENPKKNKSC